MASQPIYQFYVELQDYKPKLWRRFQTVNNISVARLGYILMTMFEMEASHLFGFDVPVEENFRKCTAEFLKEEINEKVLDLFREDQEQREIHIELPNEDDDFDERDLDAAQTKIKNVLDHETEQMTFCYDYGDGWEFLLTLEKILEDKELPGRELPRVLDGAGYGIIEDCGGVYGLEQIAKAFKKKKGAQYRDYCDWLGTEDLDLSAFDRDDMNFRLKKVPRIYENLYEYRMVPTNQSIDLIERKYMAKK